MQPKYLVILTLPVKANAKTLAAKRRDGRVTIFLLCMFKFLFFIIIIVLLFLFI